MKNIRNYNIVDEFGELVARNPVYYRDLWQGFADYIRPHLGELGEESRTQRTVINSQMLYVVCGEELAAQGYFGVPGKMPESAYYSSCKIVARLAPVFWRAYREYTFTGVDYFALDELELLPGRDPDADTLF